MISSSQGLIDGTYYRLRKFAGYIQKKAGVLMRRMLRLLALPYCFLYMINWQECNKSKLQVSLDLLYIFFRLRYFPDNYSLCRLWEKDRSVWRYYYGSIYDAYQRERLSKIVQKPEYQILFDDKFVCYQLCKAADLPVPYQYGKVENADDCRELLEDILTENPDKKAILKPVRSERGEGIALAYAVNGRIVVRVAQQELELREYSLFGPSVVQEYVTQHPQLAVVAPSTNTVRVVTMLTPTKKVLFVGALMRFGVGDAFLDNVSLGGVAVGVDMEQGMLNNEGIDFQSRVHTCHPTSGVQFENFEIPNWKAIVTLCKRIQLEFDFYKLLGLDILMTSSGPILIEINSAHDNVGLEQAYGPILEKNDVLQNFRDYSLLINGSIRT